MTAYRPSRPERKPIHPMVLFLQYLIVAATCAFIGAGCGILLAKAYVSIRADIRKLIIP
jgi:hypothetical protein